MAVHLAGNDVTIEGRVIQRCLICGYKLIDDRPDHTMVPEGMDCGFSTWPVGHLIEVTEMDGMTEYVNLGDTKQPSFDAAWSDCCINLVEECD